MKKVIFFFGLRARGCPTSVCVGSVRFSGSGAAVALDALAVPVKSTLPANLTIVGLPAKREKSVDTIRKPRIKSSDVSLRERKARNSRGNTAVNEFGRTKREEKKSNFFSGNSISTVDRLSSSGKPLLKHVLRDNTAIGNYSDAVAACEARLESGEKIDHRIITTMIRTFGSAGELDKAIELFSRIGKDRNLRLKLDSFHCAAVIHACGTNRQWHKALELLEICRRDGRVALNAIVYSTAMTACVNGKRSDKALQVFDELKKSGVKVDTLSYNIALRAAAKIGKHDTVLDIFSEMLDEGKVRPDIVTYMALLHSCGVAGDHTRALSLLHDIKKVAWLKPNVKMYTAVVTACINAGDAAKALEILKEVSGASSVALRMAEMEESGDISSELLHWKPETRFSGGKFSGLSDAPDSLLLGLGIVACSMQPSHGDLAVELLNQIIGNRMKPTYSHISHVIKSLELDGSTTECVRIYRMAQSAGYLYAVGDNVDIVDSAINSMAEGTAAAESSTRSNSRPHDCGIKINLNRLYGDHMIRTRIESVFEYLLRKRVMSSVDNFRPSLLFVIGTDKKKKHLVEEYLNNTLQCGNLLQPKWVERQGVFTLCHNNLSTWAVARMKDVKKGFGRE